MACFVFASIFVCFFLVVNAQVCPLSTWGETCEACGHCEGGVACDRDNGVCSSGCQPGWTGSWCNAVCPLSTWGETCEACGQCEGGVACDRGNGVCPSGCKPGWTGSWCNAAVEGGSQDQGELSSGQIIGAVLGVVAIVTIIVIVIVIIFLRNRRNQRREQHHNNSAASHQTSSTGVFQVDNPAYSASNAQRTSEGNEFGAEGINRDTGCVSPMNQNPKVQKDGNPYADLMEIKNDLNC